MNTTANSTSERNPMGTRPVWSLLLTMALPVILSTAVQSLYNIIDGIFVSRLGENALTAITFSGPCVTILTAVGSGIAVGMNTMLSRALGAGEKKQAEEAVSGSIFLGIIGYLLILLASLTAVRPYLQSQTDQPDILNAGMSYLSIYLGCGFASIAQVLLERMLIATGKTLYSMISQTTGAVLNLILDPIFIFGWFGLPAMGISGAAAATVISQLTAAGLALWLNLHKNKEIHIHISLRPSTDAIWTILNVGVPTTLLMSLTSIMIINYNMVLNQFSSAAVAVFGACSRITGLFYAIVNALCSATVPVIAFNYGARNRQRINETIKYGYLYGLAIMLVGTILCIGFPAFSLKLFHATEEMMEIGILGIRMLSCCFLLVSVRIMSATIVQALGHGFPSMLVDITRNYILLVPLAWLLSLTGSLNAVWMSVPIADTGAALVGILLAIRYYRKDVRTLTDTPD